MLAWARVVAALHVTFMLLVAFSWLFPWHWQAAVLGVLALATVLGHACFGGRCAVTLLEYHLRLHGGDFTHPRGMMRRVLQALGWRVDERTASGVAYGVAIEAALVGLVLALLG